MGSNLLPPNRPERDRPFTEYPQRGNNETELMKLTIEIRRLNNTLEGIASAAPGIWSTLTGALMNIGEVISNNTAAIEDNTEAVDTLADEITDLQNDGVTDDLVEPDGVDLSDEEDDPDYDPSILVYNTENVDFSGRDYRDKVTLPDDVVLRSFSSMSADNDSSEEN